MARVSTSGSKPGERSLRDSGPTCDALGEAVSVAIALLLDTRAAEGSAAEQPSAQIAQPGDRPVPQSPPEPDAGADIAPRPSTGVTSWHAQAALGAGGGYGLGGAGSLIGFGSLGAHGEHWLLELGAQGNLPNSTGSYGGTVDTSLVFGSLRACYLFGRSLALGPCAELGLGRLHGEGDGFGQGRSSNLLWTAGGLGLAAQAALSDRLFATFGATLWVPSRRQTFSVQNAGIAWESKPVAGLLSAGLGARLF